MFYTSFANYYYHLLLLSLLVPLSSGLIILIVLTNSTNKYTISTCVLINSTIRIGIITRRASIQRRRGPRRGPRAQKSMKTFGYSSQGGVQWEWGAGDEGSII